MNLLKLGPALERFVDAASAALQVDGDACTHHWNRTSDCRLCIDACPVQAITLETAAEIALDQERCVQCGCCLHLCPTGVFSSDKEETRRLLQTVAALAPCTALDLTCPHLPVVQARAADGAIVETGSCLAALGVSAYIGLAALGIERVGVRVDTCDQCPIGSLRTQIETTAAAAWALTAISITLVEQTPTQGEKRPVHSTRAPLVSRRSLWQRLRGSVAVPISPLPPLEDGTSGSKQPPPERRALLHQLAHLPDARRASAPYFLTLTADASCTACGVCATVCPTAALALTADGTTFALEFAPLACTDCGLCTQLCPPQALQPGPQIAYGEAYPLVLLTGQRKQCRRCHAPFAGSGELCPVCAFRRQNPTASMTRPPTALT